MDGLEVSLTRLHKVLYAQQNHTGVANAATIPQPGAAVGEFFLALMKGAEPQGLSGCLWVSAAEFSGVHLKKLPAAFCFLFFLSVRTCADQSGSTEGERKRRS